MVDCTFEVPREDIFEFSGSSYLGGSHERELGPLAQQVGRHPVGIAIHPRPVCLRIGWQFAQVLLAASALDHPVVLVTENLSPEPN